METKIWIAANKINELLNKIGNEKTLENNGDIKF